MEKTSTANDLTGRLRRRLESERREIEELTASELERLGDNSRRVARNALRTIERDTAEATGRMRALLMRAWLRPLLVGLSLWLGICGGSWATMHWLWTRIEVRIEKAVALDLDIEEACGTLAQLPTGTLDDPPWIRLAPSRFVRFLVWSGRRSYARKWPRPRTASCSKRQGRLLRQSLQASDPRTKASRSRQARQERRYRAESTVLLFGIRLDVFAKADWERIIPHR